MPNLIQRALQSVSKPLLLPLDDFRPRLAFRVGVTGHRDLNAETCQALRPRVRARLEQIKHLTEQAATKPRTVYYKHSPAVLRAVSPLAEGADRIFAEEALELGYELECPLPFHCQEYRNDFTDEISTRQFDELLAKAIAVFELDGTRKDAPAAYALVGQLVVDQCDMLLAIWDGNDVKGTGGTAQVVQQATRRRIPVVWLHPDAREPDVILPPDESEHGGRDNKGEIDERIKEAVWRHLLPPKGLDPTRPLGPIEGLPLGPIEGRLARMLQPWVWRLFERALTVGVRRTRGPAGAPSKLSGFSAEYARWDGLATRFAGLYRVAFLLNYVLGFSAVFLAIIGNAAEGRWLWPAVCESILIWIVITLMTFLQTRRWHMRMADCRYLAERFRIFCYTYPLGLPALKPHPPALYLHAKFLGPLEWHMRAIVRLTPMPTAKVTEGYLLRHSEAMRKWVRGQIHYHDRNAAKLETIERRLIRLCWWFIWLSLLAALSAWMFHSAVEQRHLERLLLFFTAGLPAASAAAHAISTQGEFRRLVELSESTARLLRSCRKDIDRQGPSTAAYLRRQTEDLAQVLLDEVAQWQILYRKPAPPPG